jgi:hypothetical protein
MKWDDVNVGEIEAMYKQNLKIWETKQTNSQKHSALV